MDYSNDDEWEEVYSTEEWIEGTYYQTYGGGPEGGYLVLHNGDVFSIERSWFERFTSDKCKNVKFEYIPQNEMKGIVSQCRIVKVDN